MFSGGGAAVVICFIPFLCMVVSRVSSRFLVGVIRYHLGLGKQGLGARWEEAALRRHQKYNYGFLISTGLALQSWPAWSPVSSQTRPDQAPVGVCWISSAEPADVGRSSPTTTPDIWRSSPFRLLHRCMPQYHARLAAYHTTGSQAGAVPFSEPRPVLQLTWR